MGTRSVIAIPTDSGFRGRYCHWDGYPSHQLPALFGIVARLGVDVARRTLTEDHRSWSHLVTPDRPASTDSLLGAGGTLPGVGVFHTDLSAHEDPWITNRDTDSWCEWAHVLNDGGVAVFEATSGAWAHVADVRYRDPLTEDLLRWLDDSQRTARRPAALTA